MGSVVRGRGTGPGTRRSVAIFLVVVLLAVSVPAMASVYDYIYASNTGTVTTPTVTLGAGTAGSTLISSVAADAATVTTTAGLTFYESANAAVSSVAIDGSNSAGTSGKKTSLAVTITTTKANDIVYLVASLPTGIAVSSVSDTSALTWTHRATQDANNERVETWYAASAGILSGDSVTVSIGASNRYSVAIFGVSGANTASPFDPSFASAQVATGSGTSGSITLSTTKANDLIVAGITVQNAAIVTASAPLTLVAPIQSPQETGAAGYDQVTSVQTSAAFSFAWTGTNGWSMIADAFTEAIPAATSDSSVTTPATSSSFSLPALSSAYVWSPTYTVASTLYGGSWVVDYWGSGATAGTLNIDVYIVDSSNAVVSTMVGSAASGSFGTTSGEVVTTLSSVPGGTVPANGRVLLVLTAPKGGPTSFTIAWGTGQLSNFRTPNTYNYVLSIANAGGTAWNVDLATTSAQTSNLGRLTATLSFVSPASTQIVVTSGSLTQASGSSVSLAASGTINIQVVATANAIPTSGNVPSTITFSIKVASTTSTAYAQYTVVLNVN